ncbi:MAG TPA: helix-turn-helix domain-containing protein [Solirubrobacteraceae bacterium]|jgi:AcrR family transcriptional regulator|nr:helix-turn-helix domain-containing protein [Solirubrobacteraceae bacterium]
MRKDAELNRERIAVVARRLIASQGANVSMEAIASGAGVAVGTLYRHYHTKAALVEAVIEHSVADLATLATATDAAIEAGGDPEAELASLLRSIAGRGSENRALRAAALSLGVPNPLRPTENPPAPGSQMSTTLDALDRVIDAARAAGVVRDDVTRLDIAVLLRGVLDIQLDDRSRDRYVEIILAGLRPSPR